MSSRSDIMRSARSETHFSLEVYEEGDLTSRWLRRATSGSTRRKNGTMRSSFRSTGSPWPRRGSRSRSVVSARTSAKLSTLRTSRGSAATRSSCGGLRWTLRDILDANGEVLPLSTDDGVELSVLNARIVDASNETLALAASR